MSTRDLAKGSYGKSYGGGGSGKGSASGTASLAKGSFAKGYAKAATKPTESGVGGGTTTSPIYTPGSVPNFPDADALTVLEKIALPAALSAIPGANAALSAATAAKAYSEGDIGKMTTLFGGDPGKQRGYQPDRFKGSANTGGIGDPGSAGGQTADERSIAGRSYGAGTQALVGDSDSIPAGPGGDWSDVTLQDRRKPRQLGAGTQMLLGAA